MNNRRSKKISADRHEAERDGMILNGRIGIQNYVDWSKQQDEIWACIKMICFHGQWFETIVVIHYELG